MDQGFDDEYDDESNLKGRGRHRSDQRKLTHLMGIRLPPDLHARLDIASKRQQESPASLTRRILAEALKYEEPLSASRPRKPRRNVRLSGEHRAMIQFLAELQILNARLAKLSPADNTNPGAVGSWDAESETAQVLKDLRGLLARLLQSISEARR